VTPYQAVLWIAGAAIAVTLVVLLVAWVHDHAVRRGWLTEDWQ
jgi:hypothetical protein